MFSKNYSPSIYFPLMYTARWKSVETEQRGGKEKGRGNSGRRYLRYMYLNALHLRVML